MHGSYPDSLVQHPWLLSCVRDSIVSRQVVPRIQTMGLVIHLSQKRHKHRCLWVCVSMKRYILLIDVPFRMPSVQQSSWFCRVGIALHRQNEGGTPFECVFQKILYLRKSPKRTSNRWTQSHPYCGQREAWLKQTQSPLSHHPKAPSVKVVSSETRW